MEGRARWVIVNPGIFRDTWRSEEAKWRGDGYWTGKFQYPMWEPELELAKSFSVKDQAESDLLFLVALHPGMIGRLVVESYMHYGPRLGEV